jgi:hypothetical protein
MSNRTFVCFTCRTTERVPIARLTRKCRKCHAPAEHVYYKFRIPRADDDKGWSDLMQRVREVNRTIREGALKHFRSRAERYARALKGQPEKRTKAAEARLREIEEKIRKYEQWR